MVFTVAMYHRMPYPALHPNNVHKYMQDITIGAQAGVLV